MERDHRYDVSVRWTGNRGTGTSTYRAYDRSHLVQAYGRPAIVGSSDPAFRGSLDRWSPEQLLVAALSQCHMLWYLHLAAVSGVVVTDYADDAVGTMAEDADGGGCFTEVVLRPRITVTDASMVADAMRLHAPANAKCFIARSMSFPVRHEPTIAVRGDSPGTSPEHGLTAV